MARPPAFALVFLLFTAVFFFVDVFVRFFPAVVCVVVTYPEALRFAAPDDLPVPAILTILSFYKLLSLWKNFLMSYQTKYAPIAIHPTMAQ